VFTTFISEGNLYWSVNTSYDQNQTNKRVPIIFLVIVLQSNDSSVCASQFLIMLLCIFFHLLGQIVVSIFFDYFILIEHSCGFLSMFLIHFSGFLFFFEAFPDHFKLYVLVADIPGIFTMTIMSLM